MHMYDVEAMIGVFAARLGICLCKQYVPRSREPLITAEVFLLNLYKPLIWVRSGQHAVLLANAWYELRTYPCTRHPVLLFFGLLFTDYSSMFPACANL